MSKQRPRGGTRPGAGRAGRKAPPKRPLGPAILGIGGVTLVVALLVYLVYRAVVSTVATGSGATMSDHWHAPFKVVVCGERLGPFPPSPGDVHTHGDDVIHIHPASTATQGRNASIETFLRGVPFKVTATSLEVNGKKYNNGDKCPDGKEGTVAVLVNGKPAAEFLSYTPRDRDEIEFRFGP
jgi:hypothetical protein